MPTIRIASVQLTSHHDIDDNLVVIERAIASAANDGAHLVVLPENACLMGSQRHAAARFDELSRTLADFAKSCRVHLVAGTLPCPLRADGSAVPDGKFRQVSLAFDDMGEELARYDKVHLFRATVSDGVGSYDEGRTFEAGDRAVIAPFVIEGVSVNVGLMICFDLRFPHLAQMLRQMGADVLTAPSAFTYQTGRAHWQMLLQARALDSQCLLVGATQGGRHEIGREQVRETWGHSTLVSAHGETLATTGVTDVDERGFGLAIADFDKDAQDAIRHDMPIFNCHRLA